MCRRDIEKEKAQLHHIYLDGSDYIGEDPWVGIPLGEVLSAQNT